MNKLSVSKSRNAAQLAKRSKQKGTSLLGVLLLISVAIFLGMFALKVIPAYLEYKTVAQIADDVANNPDLLRKPKSKINQYLAQAYRTNSLWDLRPEETIKLSKNSKKGYMVTVDYEKRSLLFANIFIVSKFNKEAGAI